VLASSPLLHRRLAFALLIAAATALGSAATSSAEIDGDQFRSKDRRITIRAPRNWQLTEQTSYPDILLWMTRKNPDGRMLLAAEPQRDKIDAAEYARRTAVVLQRLGFTVRTAQRHAATGAWWFDFDNCGNATSCPGKVFLRQAFLVEGNVGYSLTLAAPDARTRGQHLRAFDAALRSIVIQRGSIEVPIEDPGAAPGQGVTPADDTGARIVEPPPIGEATKDE